MLAQKIDAVLPLVISDYERFCVQQTTLEAFMKPLGTCWVVTTDRDYKTLSARIGGGRYQVLPESELVPEMRFFPKVKGWYRQQLIKLAIADWVATDFYLTLDADVLCTRLVQYQDLVRENRAPCFAHPDDRFPEWYANSERVLDMHRSGIYHNVTPCVLSKAGVISLQGYLAKRAEEVKLPFHTSEVFYHLLHRLPSFQMAWRVFLLRTLPWTEYSLYYTYLENVALFDLYHFWTKNCIYSVEESIWSVGQFADWDPRRVFSDMNKYCFCVVQSRTGIAASEVAARIAPFLGTCAT
jgi:hypothetical protein